MSVLTRASYHRRISAGLGKAEAFIERELEVRQTSYLPDKSPYISEARAALKAVRAAIEAVRVISAADGLRSTRGGV